MPRSCQCHSASKLASTCCSWTLFVLAVCFFWFTKHFLSFAEENKRGICYYILLAWTRPNVRLRYNSFYVEYVCICVDDVCNVDGNVHLYDCGTSLLPTSIWMLCRFNWGEFNLFHLLTGKAAQPRLEIRNKFILYVLCLVGCQFIIGEMTVS